MLYRKHRICALNFTNVMRVYISPISCGKCKFVG